MSLPPLSPQQMVKPRNFELRMSLIFLSLFIPLGVHVPYFPLWLEAKGFGAEQIGIILAAPMFLRVVTTPFITAMADEAQDRATVFILLVGITLALSAGYFLPPTYVIVLAVSLALTVAWTPQSPVADSLALSGVRRFGSNYTRMRIWGSGAYLLGNLGGGYILAWTGADAVPAIITLSLCFTLAVSVLAPRMGKPRRASPLSAAELEYIGPRLANRFFVLMVAGAGVINASHALVNSFGSIYWKSIGIHDTTIGVLWAWAVVAEVGIFLIFTRLFSRFSAQMILGLAGVGAMLRWIAFPMVEPLGLGVPGFFAVQSLHSLSTALILIGVQKMIAETVPEERTGAAQGIAFFANGLAFAAATLLSGPLYDRLGVHGFYAMVAIAAAGLVIVTIAPRSAPESGQGR